MGPVLRLRNAADGLSGGGSLRLGTDPALLAAATQGPHAGDEALLRGRGLRGAGRVPASALSSWVTCACPGVKPVREPDAGKPHVRFDEEGRETRDGPLGEWTPTRKGGNSGAPPDLYTTALALHSTERECARGTGPVTGATPPVLAAPIPRWDPCRCGPQGRSGATRPALRGGVHE